MTWVLGGAAMLVTALVQVTWAPKLALAGAFPNLVLVGVVAIAWTRGQRAALVWACAGGLLLDLTAPGPLGPHALALLVVAYLTGFWVRNVDGSQLGHAVIATAAGTVAYSLVLMGANDLLELPLPAWSVAVEIAGAAAVYNAVLIIPAITLTLSRKREREIATE